MSITAEKLKFPKCQKVRQIQIEIPQQSKGAGNPNWTFPNVKKCGKSNLKFPKCQKVRGNFFSKNGVAHVVKWLSNIVSRTKKMSRGLKSEALPWFCNLTGKCAKY